MFKPKAAQKEYEKYMLPRNRKEVFFDVIKLNWLRFLLYGCFILLISLPIHLSAFLGDLYQIRLSAALDTGELTAEKAVLLASSSGNTLAMADIILYVIFAVLFSGFAHVIRQHAWEESVYFRYEYIKGIRQNAGSFALLGLLTGLVRFGCVWFYNMFAVNAAEAYYFVGLLPAAWAVILLVPPAAYLTVCIPIYAVRFHQNVRTAFMLYFHHFLKTLPAVVLCGAICMLRFIPGLFFHMAGRLALSFAVPFLTLAWFLFTLDRLDETINKKLYPQLVGRGVYQKEKSG